MSSENNSIDIIVPCQEAFKKALEIIDSYDVENIEIRKGTDGKYHYIYLTQNLLNGKFYIGKHTYLSYTNSYIGSGNKVKSEKCPFNLAIKKYGKGNFKKTILKFFETSKEAFDGEKELLSLDFIRQFGYVAGSIKICYNIKVGGFGGMDGFIHSEETKKQRSESQKKSFSTEEHKKKRSDAVKKIWEETKEARRVNMKNRLADPETKERQRKASKESLARREVKEKLSSSLKEAFSIKIMIDPYGLEHSIHKDNLCEKLKEGWNIKAGTINLYHPLRKEDKSLILRKKGLDFKRQQGKLINFLDNGWIIGQKSKLDPTSDKTNTTEKRRASLREAKSSKTMIDGDGNKQIVASFDILNRLRDGWIFDFNDLRIYNPETNETKNIRLRSKVKNYDIKNQHSKVIYYLEKGWVFGTPLNNLREDTNKVSSFTTANIKVTTRYSTKKMTNLEGLEMVVPNNEILSKLKEGWTLNLKKARIIHPVLIKDKSLKLSDYHKNLTLVREGRDTNKAIKSLIEYLEQGWEFGVPSLL